MTQTFMSFKKKSTSCHVFCTYDNSPGLLIFIGCLSQALPIWGESHFSFSKIINAALTFERMRSTLTILKYTHLAHTSAPHPIESDLFLTVIEDQKKY